MNEELEKQASLYVFGLLERGEAVAFERRLQSDADLRDCVDQLDETAALIAHSAPPHALPPALRSKVLGQIRAGKTAAFPRRASWVPWAIAAGLALSCAYLIAERSQLRKRVARLEQRDILSQVQIATLSSRLEKPAAATAVVIWDKKKQRGVLKLTQVPTTAADRDYQLWMVDPRYKNPISAAVFHVENKGAFTIRFQPAAPIREVKGFAISLERKGGVLKAKGPIVMLGK